MSQQEQPQTPSQLRKLNRDIAERQKYLSSLEKQIEEATERGNNILIELNDVILQKKHRIKAMTATESSLETRIENLFEQEAQLRTTQTATAGI